LRQADALSTVLFDLVLGEVIRDIETSTKETVFNRTRQYIAYADDMLILGRSVGVIEAVVTRRCSTKHWIGDK
jgi:hypothetical protein